MKEPINIHDIRAAAERVRPFIRHPPVMTCTALDERAGARLFFKCENFQKTGSFKFRGATNAVRSLAIDELANGVATHSSGNHGAALALAAAQRGAPAFVVMPQTASRVKRLAVGAYGAKITDCPPAVGSRDEYFANLLERTGACPIHPYNDRRIIAGQGTAALELCEEVGGLDIIVTPVGGGGLLSGSAIAAHALVPGIQVLGAEPELADAAARSMQAGEIVPARPPASIADGLLSGLGDLTFMAIRQNVDDIITVTEDAIIAAMRQIWQRMKIVAEPSAAVPLAAILLRPDLAAGKRVGIVLSGGNVDLDRLPW